MAKLVVVDDGTVFSMVSDAALAAEIPCLHGKKELFKPTGGGCSACAKQRNAKRRDDLNKIKSCLSSLSPEKRETLRRWLGAEQVRILYTNSGGQVVQVNF